MKNYLRLALLALVLVATLWFLASCGSSGGGSQGNGSGGDMEGMDHGSMNPEDMARQMVAPNGEYSDKHFIDAMVPHHQGAVEMAEVALKNAEHKQIKQLAEDIVTAQEAEIEEL
ncbi:MAG: DUF305 domain-containing protein [Actinomycetota bacterium]|nr:DUF305 domain-containing protein [Actinomycetota bacterium]